MCRGRRRFPDRTRRRPRRRDRVRMRSRRRCARRAGTWRRAGMDLVCDRPLLRVGGVVVEGGSVTQKGAAPLEVALGMGLLVLPALIVVLAFSPWLEARTFVRAAAAEAASAAALARADRTALA